MADSKADIKKTTPPSEWFKNVAKSVGYSTSDIVKDITPGIHSFVSNNVTYGKELVSNARDSMEDSKTMVSMFSMDNHYKIGQDAIKNALDDIKSGKIYNKERKESFDDEDGFGEFMMDFEDGGGSSSSSDADTSPTVINNTKIIQKDDSRLISAVEFTANSTLKASESMMKQQANLIATKATMDHSMGINTLKGLETINENIGQLVNFQNDSMSKYVAASISYYDESLGVMKNSLERITAMIPENKNDDRVRTDMFEEIFGGGGFSLEGYAKNVKSNFQQMKDTNMIVNFVSSVFEDESTLSMLAKSPLEFVSNTLTKHIIPMSIRATMEQLDKSVTEFFPAMINKLSRLAVDNNPLLQMVGELFGVDTKTKAGPNMANYMRGAIPFDGETKRAITDVIPTYLRKIYSHLSGKKEVGFDWESGTWKNASDMKKEYEIRKLDQATSGYSEQYSKMQDMSSNVRFNSEKERKSFETGMQQFLLNLSRSTEKIKFDGSAESKTSVNNLHDFGSNRQLQDLFYAMVSNLDRSEQVKMVGSSRYKAQGNLANLYQEIEKNPTLLNANTVLGGLDIDDHISVNGDGKITKAKAGIGGLGRIDKYGKDDLYYLRNINDAILEGIRVYPVSEVAGNDLESIVNRLDKFRGQKAEKIVDDSAKQNPTLTGDKADTFNRNLGIDLTSGKDYNFDDRIKQLNQVSQSKKNSNTDKFGDTIGSSLDKSQEKFNRVREKLDSVVRKPADLLEKAFDKIDQTMYNIVFGLKDDGRGSFMDITLDKMQEMFANVGSFAMEKVFLPIGDLLGTTGKKALDAANDNFLVKAVKDGVKYWFVGDQDENGKRQGGVLSDLLNSAKDAAKGFNHTITGASYKDSNGVTHDKNDESFFGQSKTLLVDIYKSTKSHFFGDKDASNPDERRGMMSTVTDSLGNGMADWANIIFGKEKDRNKSGTEILKENTTSFVKNVPRGLVGMLGGATAGGIIAGGGLGLIGSMFLPGAPIALAMVGGALGMATGFDSFNDWAFGEIGGNGKRIGGNLLSANTKEFMSRNKNKLIGGAIGGMALGAISSSILSQFDPTGGILVGMLSPFGPLGSAVQGMATAMIMRSDAVMNWIFGAKDMDGVRMGGMLQRLFKKPNMEISKKAIGGTAGLAAVGMFGGAALGAITSNIASIGILPALLATPIGPITGAVAGLAAAIALSSGTVRKFLFGKFDEGKEDIGAIGRMTNMMRMEVFEPGMEAIRTTIDHTINWFQNNFMAKVAFVTEPLIRTVMDSVTGTAKVIKGLAFDIPWFLAKTTGNIITGTLKGAGNLINGAVKGSLGAIKTGINTIFGKEVVEPAMQYVGNLSRVIGAGIVRPFAKLGETIFKSSVAIQRGMSELGVSALMAPAAMKMTFDQLMEGGKSAFRNFTGLFKKENGETFGERFKHFNAKIMTDIVTGKSSYVDTLNNNYQEKMANWRERRGQIKEESKARRGEWKGARALARGTKYNDLQGDGEGMTLARIIKSTSGRRMRNRDQIVKLQQDVFKKTGVTVNQLLGLNPDEDITELSKNQLKALQNMIKTSNRVGKTGKDFEDHLGITKYQKSQEEALRSINDEMKDAVVNLKDINKSITDVAKGSTTVKVEIVNKNNSVGVDDVVNDQVSKISYKNLKLKEYDDSKKKDRGAGRRARKEQNKSTDESMGGALSGFFGGMTSKLKSLTGSYDKNDINEFGCGPIVLALAMSVYGTKADPRKIFEFAHKNGLVTDGMGVSSDVFSSYGKTKGFKVHAVRASASNLVDAFKKSQAVIARLNTGAGHFVLLHSYSDGVVKVKDPMNKFKGATDINSIIRYITHLYVVIKSDAVGGMLKDVKDIKNKIFKPTSTSARTGTSNSSLGGAVAGNAMDGSDLGVNTINVNGLSALPVYIVKSKADTILEEKRHDEIVSVQGGGSSDNDPIASASGNSQVGALSPISSRNVTLNRINGIIKLIAGTSRIARNTGRGIIDVSSSAIDSVRDGSARGKMSTAAANAKGRVGTAVVNAKATAAGGSYAMAAAMMNGAVSGVGKVRRIGAKIARGIGGAGANSKLMNTLVQAGTTASHANLAELQSGYSTSTTGQSEYQIDEGASPAEQAKKFNAHRTVNAFLRQKAAEAKAQSEANFNSTMVDLSTRIEINTRYTAQRLDDLFNLNDKFFKWLKPFLENLDFCCPPGGGGGGGGGGGLVVAPPIVNKGKNTTGTNAGSRTLLGVPPTGKPKNNTGTKIAPPPTSTGTLVTTPNGRNNIPGTMVLSNPKSRQVGPVRQPTARPGGIPLPMPMGMSTNRQVKDAKTGKYRDLPTSKYPILDAKYEVIDDNKTRGKSLPIPNTYIQETKTTKPREKVLVEANRPSEPNNRKIINADPVQPKTGQVINSFEADKNAYKKNFDRMMEERQDNERKLKRGPATSPEEFWRFKDEDDRIAREREEKRAKADAKANRKAPGRGGRFGSILNVLNNQRGSVDAGKILGGFSGIGGAVTGALKGTGGAIKGGASKAGSVVSGALKGSGNFLKGSAGIIGKGAGLATRVAGNIPFLNLASAGVNAYNARERSAQTFGVDEATGGQKLASTIGGGVIGFIPGVGMIDYMTGGVISDVASKGLYSAGSAIGKAGEAIAPIASKAWEGTKNIGGKLFDASPIGQVKGAIQGFSNDDKVRANLGKGADGNINTFDRIQSGASEVASKATFGLIKPETIGKAAEEIEALATQTFETIKGKVTSIKDTTGTVWEAAKTVVSTKWDETKTTIGTKVGEVVSTTSAVWGATKTLVSDKWEETKTAVSDKVVEVVTNTATAWGATKTLISGKWEETKTAVSDKVTEVVTNTATVWGATKTLIAGKWDSTKKEVSETTASIVTATKEKWGSMKTTAAKKWDDTKTAITEKAQGMVTDAKTKWESAKTGASKKWDTFKTDVSTKAGEIKSAITDKLKDGVAAIAPKFVGFATSVGSLAGDIASGIKSKLADAKSKIASFFGKGEDDVDKNKKDVGGPAKEATDKMNKEVMGVGGPFCTPDPTQYGKGKDDVYYSQNDIRWSNKKLAGDTTFGKAGCGPTAVANVISSMTGNEVLPTDALEFAQKNNLVDPARGTSSNLFSSFGLDNGVAIHEDKASTDNVMSQLAQGNKVILRGENGSNYTSAGHYIVADGLTKDGKIKIKDPMGKGRSGEFSPDVVGKGLTNAFVASSGNTLANLIKNPKATFGSGASGFSNPAPNARVSSPFGWRDIGQGREFHYGIDLAQTGTVKIQAAAEGEVTFAGPRSTYGNVVMIKHTINGKRMDTVYAHLRDGSIRVKVGEAVKQGQNLGLMGSTGRSTGQHLHFEIHDGAYNYGKTNIDPEPYIFKNSQKTPTVFDGPTGIAGTIGAAALALTGGMSDKTSLFDTNNIIPGLNILPTITKNMADMFLFGATGSILAGTSFGNSSDSGSVDTTYTSETIKPYDDKALFKGSYADVINKYAKERNLEPALLAAIIKQESGFNPKATSPAGAQGLMQLMPKTAKSLGVANSFDPDQNVMGGSMYVRQQINKFKDLGLALAAYNAGPNNASVKAGKIPQNGETEKYVSKVIGNLKSFRAEDGVGGPLISEDISKNNIYDIMKKSGRDKSINDTFKLKDTGSYGKGGPGCTDCGNKVSKTVSKASNEFEALDKIMDKSKATAVHAAGRLNEIHRENKRYQEMTARSEQVYASGDTIDIDNIQTSDAWSTENVTRAIKALETIAANTSEMNTGVSTMNTHFSTTNVSGNSANGGKTPSAQPSGRHVNQSYVERNKQVLKPRK